MLDAAERHSAKSFLEEFDPKARRKGRAAYRHGRIGEIALTQNGKQEIVAAAVNGLPPVELVAEQANWSGLCGCGALKCEHIYAAMLSLLRNGQDFDAGAEENARRGLLEYVSASLGRKLTKQETAFVGQILQLQKGAWNSGVVDRYGLQSLLLFDWYRLTNPARLSPAALEDEVSFWHEVAAYSIFRNGKIPDFLRRATDFARIEELLKEQHRGEEIERWRHTLETTESVAPIDPNERLDFRVVIAAGRCRAEYTRAGASSFRAAKAREWEQLVQGVERGAQQVIEEAWPVFSAFAQRVNGYGSTDFPLTDRWTKQMLSALLRQRFLEPRIVNAEGKPFAWKSAALRWRLEEAGKEDYALRLVDESGAPVGELIADFPGNPHLYLTANHVYPGPFRPQSLPLALDRIPAAALETQEGMRVLVAMGVPLPARLANRTRKVSMNVTIRCGLRRATRYDNTEFCELRVTAKASEGGRMLQLKGTGWAESESRAKSGNNGPLYIYEEGAMARASQLVSELGAAWVENFETDHWRARVTKNFGDRFLAWHKSVPAEITVLLEGELASLVRDPVLARVALSCEEVSVDWFDLRTTLKVEDTTLTAEELKLLLNARGKVVRLPGKGWRRLEYQTSEEDEASLARMGLSSLDFSAEPQRLHALQLAEQAAERMLAAEQFRRIQERASEIKTRVTPDVPAGIRATLRPYQVEGFHFLAYLSENSFGGVLADDMGLGKTVQALTWLAWLRAKDPSVRSSLVVCPKSVMDNWASEATKFLPGLRVKLWRTTESESLAKLAAATDLLVLNYPQLRSLAADAARIDWLAIILDEAQAIKNPESQTAQAARALRGAQRLALSGTPIENRLLDLWSIMAFAMPGVLGNRTDFKRRFDQANDKLARRRLAARVRPFLLRRTKNEVASELPDRIEEDILCEMEGTQKTLYRAELKRAQQMLLRIETQEGLNEFRFHFLTSLLRLRQICCHPALTNPEFRKEESSKLNALMEILEPLLEEGHKVLVFSQFVTMLNILQEEVTARSWNCFFLAGDTEDRGELVRKFQEHEGAALFLISLKAGGFGLNLTSASYVVLYDPWWNPAVENQAIDRTHRIGQTQKVIAYRLITKGSIEEKIRGLQKQKSALVDDVLGDEKFAASLTVEDLRYLFTDDTAD